MQNNCGMCDDRSHMRWLRIYVTAKTWSAHRCRERGQCWSPALHMQLLQRTGTHCTGVHFLLFSVIHYKRFVFGILFIIMKQKIGVSARAPKLVCKTKRLAQKLRMCTSWHVARKRERWQMSGVRARRAAKIAEILIWVHGVGVVGIWTVEHYCYYHHHHFFALMHHARTSYTLTKLSQCNEYDPYAYAYGAHRSSGHTHSQS